MTEIQEDKRNSHVSSPSTIRYAGFWMRFWAYMVDVLVTSSISTILLNPFSALDTASPLGWTYTGIIAVLIFFIYFVLMTKYFGQTLGKMIFGLKVMRKDGTPLTWNDVLFREVIGRFFYRVFGIAKILYLIIAFDKQKRGIHDMIADTIVVHEASNEVVGELSYQKNVLYEATSCSYTDVAFVIFEWIIFGKF